ncbi:MAG: hypothetical protein WAL32_13730 [Terriglobales bacterium]
MKFQAVRVTHQYTQTNSAPPEQVFPLLCPVRETEWVPGWQHTLIYSKSGVAEAGCVFITEENGREITWLITEYDPQTFRIAFVWVDPRMLTAQINITLEPETARPASRFAPPLQAGTFSRPPAAERRQNKAHGASRGSRAANDQAPEGRKNSIVTSAHIQYTYTGLSPDGNREVERFTEAWFRDKMQSWEAAINHYLKTGKCIAAPTRE